MVAEPRQLPRELQKLMNRMTKEAQDVLLELHSRFRFNDDHMEAFTLNAGAANISAAFSNDALGRFENFLQEESNKKTEKTKQAPQLSKRAAAQKRKSSGTSLASLGLGAAVDTVRGRVITPDVLMDVSTPQQTKRHRVEDFPIADAGGDIGGGVLVAAEATPKTPTKTLQVSIKSSMNDKLQLVEADHAVGVSTRVQLLGEKGLWSGRRRGAYEWMNDTIEDRWGHIDARLAEMEELMLAATLEHAGESSGIQVGAVGVPSQAEVALCGRIACEGFEGRLNERAILLEAPNGASTRLNLADCANLAAFPGQLVGVIGRTGGASGNTLHARELLAGLPIPLRPEPRGEEALHMIVAAGPYCLRDGLNYTAIDDLMKYALQRRPQVLVLFGPFLDASNQRAACGELVLPGDGEEPCSFEDVYTTHILPMLERGLAPIRKAGTEVLIVPSLEEVLCFHPMPQPPLPASLGLQPGELEGLQRLGVKMVPNPAHVCVAGLTVTLSSADALSPVLREIVLRPEGRKIEECLRQLLKQRTLFPVLPRDPPQVCEARAAALDFPAGQVPDICIFPSQCGGLTGSVVDGTAFANPGPLCRAAAPGSFAELWVVPPVGSAEGLPFEQRVRVDVQRLK